MFQEHVLGQEPFPLRGHFIGMEPLSVHFGFGSSKSESATYPSYGCVIPDSELLIKVITILELSHNTILGLQGAAESGFDFGTLLRP